LLNLNGKKNNLKNIKNNIEVSSAKLKSKEKTSITNLNDAPNSKKKLSEDNNLVTVNSKSKNKKK
jgi:hypothetical protein